MPYQAYESVHTLQSLLEHPDTFYTEMGRYSGSVTFSLLYASIPLIFEKCLIRSQIGFTVRRVKSSDTTTNILGNGEIFQSWVGLT